MQMQHVHGSHDLSLVALSFIIAFMAALTALDTARRVNFSIGWRRDLWLVSGSAAMGIGIWSMHFIAMLAFELSVPIVYDNFLVAVSVIIAIIASFCGLYFSSKTNMSKVKLFIGGTIMGTGISGMHYIGMAAMDGVSVTYNPFLFALSIFIAIGASTIALILAFQFRESESGINSKIKVISGAVMGIAIAGMHYTGMAAASYIADPSGIEKATSTFLDTSEIVIAVTISAIVILGIVLVISFMLDKRLDEEIAFNGAILESVLDCIIIIDEEGNILECNPSVTRTFGYIREKLIGQHMKRALLSESFSIVNDDGKLRCNERIEGTGIQYNGVEFPLELTITKIRKDGFPAFTVYVRDITRFKKAQKIIKQLAYQDSLTGLPNRRSFNDEFRESLKEVKMKDTKLAVFFLDLDRFKMINDSMGHRFGDLLLINVAARSEKLLVNKGRIYRKGGDEFIVLLKNMTSQEVEDQAKAIIQSLSHPFFIEGHEIFMTTSIGIAEYPKDGEEKETLVQKADIAMYDAKEKGRNQYSFYRPTNGLKNARLLQLENELRSALDREEFVLYYQPRMNIHTEQIVGVEALIRWIHPTRGIMMPGEFIPQAEESELIIPIGKWVLQTAMKQCKKWQEDLSPIQVSVNLSAVQFRKNDIVKEISDILKDEGGNATLLNLEITKNMMMDVDYSIGVLRELKKLGIMISIDDFGTGYNSLSTLKDMPIDDIKIDKSFISNLTYDSEDAAIVKAIISIGHSLKMNVIAEGVETEEQLLLLKNLGCHEMQGYLLSPPLPVADMERLIVDREQGQQALLSF